MKDWKAPKHFRGLIEHMFDFFRHRIGLGEYSIEFRYVEKIPLKGYPPGAAMQIDVDSTYLILEVDIAKKVYTESFRVGNWRGMAKVVLHELVHALTEPYYEMCDQLGDTRTRPILRALNERQTERITNAILSFVREEDYLNKK